jgi:hypothetical protein
MAQQYFTASNVWFDATNKHLYFTTDYTPRSPNDAYITDDDRNPLWASMNGYSNLATAPKFKLLMYYTSPPYAAMPSSGSYYIWFSEVVSGQDWARSQELTFPIPSSPPEGSALQTDGSQNYISLGTLGNLGSNLSNGLYIDFWINTTATGYKSQGLYDGGNYYIQYQLNSNIAAGNALNHGLAMYLSDPSGNVLQGGAASPTINFNDGSNHHVNFTVNFSAQTIAISIDDVAQSVAYQTQQALSSFTNFSKAFYVGARNENGTAGNYFAATYDAFKIGTSSSNLYGNYQMNEGVGTTVTDTSGNSNNGSLAKGAGDYPLWIDDITPDAPSPAQIKSGQVAGLQLR